ncbi:MAG TPA: heme-binding protein [Candidatus Dormibacteraeota bacterium]
MPISLTDALKAIAAAHAKAGELGVLVSATVLDEGGLPVAMGRMDGAMALSAQISEGKAIGAALLARDGDAVMAIAEQRLVFFQQVAQMARVPIVPGLGSLAIKRGGTCQGAIGISGAKPEEDLECARAALAALNL